ncbi:MAG TPA: hypothetical protein VFO30_04790 [Chthoniobacterales bacterium]|nr:hypothetical protein [Chthoniobacterales bacterium]
MSPFARSTIACAAFLAARTIIFGQAGEDSNTPVRLTMSVNQDGSRTVYKFNDAKHTATATATDADGKLREKIHYQLDDSGRFASALVFAPDGKLRFKSRYKYDSAGKLEEETQFSEGDAVLHKIVYNYDGGGKPTGYSVFDADGKLISRVAPLAPATPTSVKPRLKNGR